MRAASVLSKHVPLIKFVGGPHVIPKNISHAPKVHPMAPSGLMPSGGAASGSSISKSPVEAQNGQFFSRAELSPKYRYKSLKDLEIEQVTSGGAEYVF